MTAFRRAQSFLFDQGGKRKWSAGIVIAVLGLGAGAYFVWPETDEVLQRVRRTSPDSLQAYLLKPDDRFALAEFYRARQTLDSAAMQQWVERRRVRLQRVGLHLTEQSMLFRRRAQSSLAESKLDTAFVLGQMLMTCAQDSFLGQQSERIKNLDEHALKTRAQVSESFAAARDIFLQADYVEAAKRLERTRALARKMGEVKFLIDASYLLQYALRRQPDHKRVIALGEEILQKAQRSGYRLCLATMLSEAADAYFEMSQNDSALMIVNRAVAFGESINDTTGLARSHYSRAKIYSYLGKPDEAEHSIKEVIALDSAQRYRGQILGLYGQIAMFRCEYDHAEKLFREALQVYETRKDGVNQGQTWIELSMVKTLIGDYTNALASGTHALRLSSSIGDQKRAAIALSQIGWIHLQVDSLPHAIVALKKAVMLFPEDQVNSRANTWVALGLAYLKQRFLSEARSAFLQAEKIAQNGDLKINQVESRIGQGWVALAEGNALQAQAWFASSLDMAERINEENLAAESLYGIAETQRQVGSYDDALETLERALAIGETLRTSLRDDSSRVSYFSVRQEWFDAAIRSSLMLGDTSRAFYFAERARARAMRDALAKGSSVQAPISSSLSWSDIPPTKELLRRIPAGVQVMEYRATTDTLLVWVLESNKLFMRRIGITAHALNDSIGKFRLSLGADEYENFRRRCQDNLAQVYSENRRLGNMLFQILIGPIEHELAVDKRLYIIPDGALHLLPWGALVSTKDKFFDETYNWVKAPSFAILASESSPHTHRPVNLESKLLMVAGNLASVETQKRSLRKLFKNFTLLREVDASFGNIQHVLKTGVDITYFSVRAVADMRRPWNSYLELADELAKTGWQPRKAYVRELLGWDFLKTHLMILNACETASGKIERGEGGMSLARFFSRADIPHIVASLWQNDDRISARIIDEFLRNLQNNQDMIYCLQQAKQRCMQELKDDYQYPLPYFWAPFELHEVNFSNSIYQKFN